MEMAHPRALRARRGGPSCSPGGRLSPPDSSAAQTPGEASPRTGEAMQGDEGHGPATPNEAEPRSRQESYPGNSSRIDHGGRGAPGMARAAERMSPRSRCRIIQPADRGWTMASCDHHDQGRDRYEHPPAGQRRCQAHRPRRRVRTTACTPRIRYGRNIALNTPGPATGVSSGRPWRYRWSGGNESGSPAGDRRKESDLVASPTGWSLST